LVPLEVDFLQINQESLHTYHSGDKYGNESKIWVSKMCYNRTMGNINVPKLFQKINITLQL